MVKIKSIKNPKKSSLSSPVLCSEKQSLTLECNKKMHMQSIKPPVLEYMSQNFTQKTCFNLGLKNSEKRTMMSSQNSFLASVTPPVQELVSHPNFPICLKNQTFGKSERTVSQKQEKAVSGSHIWPIEGRLIVLSMQTLGQPASQFPVGGRLKYFAHIWEEKIQDKFVKSVVLRGYHLEWVGPPPVLSNKVIFTHLEDQTDLLAQEIQEMLAKDAIQEVLIWDPGFCSKFFLVPKKGTDQMRPVINL